ncbi:MAG: PatB family C-S lyase [Bacteroidales bacterium]|nr:PatB family C-S lyase [Bacteroidales bacterium]
MNYNFDEIISRENTASVKYDLRKQYFGYSDVFPMWVADMDFKTPDFIIKAIKKRLDHEILGYTYRPESFNSSVVNWIKDRHNWKIKKEWISFSPGIVPAINLIILALTEPGDKIIVQQPVYFPFFSAIKNHGRVVVNNPLTLRDDRYIMDFEDLKSKIDKDVKMLILCNPHNPTGNVWKKEELEQLAKICIENNILIVSDEIHSDLVYEKFRHTPLASLSEEISQQVISCYAPSKTFNLAGLSTSVIVCANPDILKRYNKTLDDIHVGSGNIFGMVALEAAYNGGKEWLEALLAYLQKNVAFIKSYFEENIPKIKLIPPESTYMVWLDCRQLNLYKEELKNFMLKEAKIGLSDGPIFGAEGIGFQRMNIACPKILLEEAITNLYLALKRIHKI